MFNPESIIGKTIEEANVVANENGYRIRVMCEDGQHFFGTCDYDLKRINVSTQNGIILPGFDFG